MNDIAASEGIEAEDQALAMIARQSTGAMRDAISLLDQLASSGSIITLEMVQEVLGTATSQSVLDLVDAIAARQAGKGLEIIHQSVDAGSDSRQYARQMVEHLRNLLIMRMGNANLIEVTPELRMVLSRQAQAFAPLELLRLLRIFNQAATEGRGTWQPSLPLELAFLEALESPAKDHQRSGSGVQSGKSPPLRTASQPDAAQKPAKAALGEPAQDSKIASSTPLPAALVEPSPDDQQANQLLSASWNKILSLVREQNPNTYGLMNSCWSRYIRGTQILMGFGSELLKDKMEKDANLGLAQNVISEVIQREVVIKCFVDTRKRGSIPPEVDEDGIVAAALRDLGGELVDMS